MAIQIPLHPMARIENTTADPLPFFCRIQMQFNRMAADGTGTFISERHVLTAAHNLYSSNYGRVVRMSIVPGQNGADKPFGEFGFRRYFFTKAYEETPAPYLIDDKQYDYTQFLYDYAVIELERPFRPSPFTMSVESTNTLKQGIGRIIGYPGDKPEGTMWQSVGSISAMDADPFLFYDISTYAGSSGAAVLKKINDRVTIVGVHVAGFEEYQRNMGLRITEEVRDNIISWMKMGEDR